MHHTESRCSCASSCQVERPLACSCLSALSQHAALSSLPASACHSLSFGSLAAFMRLDSAAAAAINLFPRPDDPSRLGSLLGLLDRCRTKMGGRLLERWLRQPLLDCDRWCSAELVSAVLCHHLSGVIFDLTAIILTQHQPAAGRSRGTQAMPKGSQHPHRYSA